MSLLRLGDIALTRGDTHVLGGVSLHVDAGEFVSILGPSGAGKSTLFELLIGGLRADAGHIAFGGLSTQRKARSRSCPSAMR